MELKTFQFTDDGSKLIADSAEQVVIFMRDGSRFAFDESIETFMEGFADRFQVQSGNRVRIDSVENFVADLLKFEFLVEVATEFPANFV
jgi:hypothetical protein